MDIKRLEAKTTKRKRVTKINMALLILQDTFLTGLSQKDEKSDIKS